MEEKEEGKKIEQTSKRNDVSKGRGKGINKNMKLINRDAEVGSEKQESEKEKRYAKKGIREEQK